MEKMCIEVKIVDTNRFKRAIKCIKRKKWRSKARQGHPPRYYSKI